MIGRTLGSYRVGELIGGGGFADVYRAQDLRSSKPVALKVLHAHMARDPALVRRFLREAKLAQQLTEPHIVRVLGYGQDAGSHFLVMEYVRGQTLDQVLRKRGRLPPNEVAALGCQALQALEAAHGAGIVHRDIKPQNLILTTGGLLKVMDFGIAKQPTAATMTRTGMYLGTVQYMSPEQAKGRAVDARSDLYALGVTLFELLGGRPPFDAPTPWETLSLQMTTPPPPLAQFRGDVPAELEQAVRRALEKEPAQRFQSAREMRDALSLVAAGGRQRVSTPAPARSSGARRLWSRPEWSGNHWLPASVAAGALVLLVALLAVSTNRASSQPGTAAAAAPSSGASSPAIDGAVVAPTSASAAERLAAARALLNSGQHSLALAALTALRESDSGAPGLEEELYRAHVAHGKDLLDKGDLDGSYQQYSFALDIRPDSPTALDGQRQVVLTKHWNEMEAAWGKDDEAAIKALEEIIGLDPAYRSVRQKLYALLIAKADRQRGTGARDEAFATLMRAIDVYPEGAEGYQRLADYTPTPAPPLALPRPAPARQPPPTPRPLRP